MRPDVAVLHEVLLAVIAAHVHITGVVVISTVIVMLALIQRDALEFEIREVLSGRLVVVQGGQQRIRRLGTHASSIHACMHPASQTCMHA